MLYSLSQEGFVGKGSASLTHILHAYFDKARPPPVLHVELPYTRDRHLGLDDLACENTDFSHLVLTWLQRFRPDLQLRASDSRLVPGGKGWREGGRLKVLGCVFLAAWDWFLIMTRNSSQNVAEVESWWAHAMTWELTWVRGSASCDSICGRLHVWSTSLPYTKLNHWSN